MDCEASDEAKEISVIPDANAVVHPRTVVIKFLQKKYIQGMLLFQ